MDNAPYIRLAQRTDQFAAGDVIFHEGDPGAEMYGVVSGEVELKRADEVIERIGEPGVFGEMSLVDQAPRNLTAVAATDCELAVIDRGHFLFLVHETPTFALHVMSTLADRIRALNHTGEAMAETTSAGLDA